MLKFLITVCLYYFFLVSMGVLAAERYQINDKSQKRSVCGMNVAKKSGLVVDVVRISENSLHTRVDNERYNACPYWVTLKYKGFKIRIDFSESELLGQVKNFDSSSAEVSDGVFSFDGKKWVGDSNVFDNSRSLITAKESDNSMIIIGNMPRKVSESQVDYCILISVLGSTLSSGGYTCAAKKSSLIPLQALFSGAPVLFFDK